MKIPNCEKAYLDIRKLQDYCLSNIHPVGKHKAKVFLSALGITADDAELLREIILDKVCNDNGLAAQIDEYGNRYTLDMIIKIRSKEATVRTAWIIKQNEDFPRLTTCYVV